MQATSILSKEAMLAHLRDKKIFVEGSWDEDCVRSSAYDIRMADDLILVPDLPHSKSRYFPRGTRRVREVILEPGDVAFISSAERFCIPWNISGAVGPKFSLAAKGVLTLTGLIIDPGYGWELSADEWVRKSDQRIHFLLANVGPAPVVLVPGQEKVATIQFSYVEPPSEKRETSSVGYSRIEDAYLNSETGTQAGLVFFRKMSDVAEKMEAANRRIGEFERRISGVETGSNQIVMFGIYLLCVTFLSVSFAILLSALDAETTSKKIALVSEMTVASWPGLLVVAFAFVGFVFCGAVGFKYAVKGIRSLLSRRDTSASNDV
ncbi:MAG: hypothetical protein RIE84_14315 [Parvibaculum sp.]|jgi:deoxycytidine triphosphate deaminase|uniref:dCTP deaminase domain-containing protein n=1 Tax=Parvibaculum sp. TaxID=2024848 RepID=UPI0032ED8EDC